VPIRDDEQFEKYLKQFLPVTPEPLPVQERLRPRRQMLIFSAWAAAAAVILLAVTVAILRYKRDETISQAVTKTPAIEMPNIEVQNKLPPLTIASANALLANSPSFKSVVESMTFQPGTKKVSQGNLSVLAVLSKEDSKL
jgi:hypothetical protein